MAVIRYTFLLLLYLTTSISLPFTANSLFPFINLSSFSPELNILNSIYEERGGDRKKFLVRNVPGYGSCLFYSLAACITFDRCFQHILFTTHKMKKFVTRLRFKAIEELKDNENTNKILHLDNNQQMSVRDVLKAAADNINMKEIEYLKEMELSKTWGGGPEIVALSNYFKRPIHVYELCSYTRFHFNPLSILNLNSLFRVEHKFKLSLCAKFGSPAFDQENVTPYCILCADGRFPHIFPGLHKKKGDHFLALYPVAECDMDSQSHTSQTVEKILKANNNNNNNSNNNNRSIFNNFLRSKSNTKVKSKFLPMGSYNKNERHVKYIYDYYPFNNQTVSSSSINLSLPNEEEEDMQFPSNIFEI